MTMCAHLSFTRCSDKRLSIDLAALRHVIWLDGLGALRDEIGDGQPDSVCWIDTSAMLADCLTKLMASTRLDDTMSTRILDLSATDESNYFVEDEDSTSIEQ